MFIVETLVGLGILGIIGCFAYLLGRYVSKSDDNFIIFMDGFAALGITFIILLAASWIGNELIGGWE